MERQHWIEDEPYPDTANAIGPAYQCIKIPKEYQRWKNQFQLQFGFFRKIRGNANEGRLFGEFPMFMQGSQSRLSDPIASTLIKTQHDVAPGDRVKQGSMRPPNICSRISALHIRLHATWTWLTRVYT